MQPPPGPSGLLQSPLVRSPFSAQPIAASSAAVSATAAQRNWLKILLPAAALVIIALAGVFYFRSQQSSKLTEKDSVILADFVNTTGDSVFDGTLKQALAVQLEQSPYLNIFPESRIQQALKFMGRSADERVTKDVAHEICLREGVKAMLTGSIANLGSHYVITLEAINAQTGDSLDREQVEADSKEQVLKSLDHAASSLREKLGESIGSVQKFTTPLEAATTSSLDALKEFSLGEAAHSKFDDETSVPHLKRAVELDPNFAMALATLGVAYYNSGESKLGFEYLQKAFDVKDRASERERFYISSHYYGTYLGQEDKDLETLEQWKQAYPRDTVPLDNLSLVEQDLGQFDKSLANASAALQLNSKDPYAYQNTAAAYTYLNRYDEAKAIADQAIALRVEPWSVHMTLYWTDFIRGDDAAMRQEVAQSSGKVSESIIVLLQAQGQCAQGKIKSARESYARAAVAAQAHGFKEWSGLIRESEADCDAMMGDVQEARQTLNSALNLSDSKDFKADAARVFARAGDSARADKMIADLAKEYPFDTLLIQVKLPTTRAILALQRNQPAQALTALESAKAHELGADRRLFNTYSTIFTRGEAFLGSHDGANAALEFQRILDHRGIQPTSPLYSCARLGLGRAYALQNDTARAKAAYQDFFAIWKDADSDVPLLKTAKAEYEKVK